MKLANYKNEIEWTYKKKVDKLLKSPLTVHF